MFLSELSSSAIAGAVRVQRFTKRKLTRRSHGAPWHHVPNLHTWSGQINTAQSEQLAGVQRKLELMRQLGAVRVVGGLTTGGGDDVFQTEWPQALSRLAAIMEECNENEFLFLYVPSPFWSQLLGATYKWLPTWNELYALFDSNRAWSIFQYSPSFDASGRYFLVAQKRPSAAGLPPAVRLSQQTFRVFFHPGGADLTQSHSGWALSAHLCNALVRAGGAVYSYAFDDLNGVAEAQPDDILIGHVGPWVKAAYDQGKRRIVLYNPANRWYPTRNLAVIEANATLAEQVAMSKMVIAQSGAIWRMTAENPEPEKWRWIDLGVDRAIFPRIKRRFNPAGQRRFCFLNLYDAAQKGADIAQEIVKARPTYRFTWIGGSKMQARNVQYVSSIPNTMGLFRRSMANCDFVLVPSREDAQPGTLVEALAFGLLPVATYTSGYSLSYPRLVVPNTPEAWLAVLDTLQSAASSDLVEARNVFDTYLKLIHDWHGVEDQITWYLREFLTKEQESASQLYSYGEAWRDYSMHKLTSND